MSTDGEAEKPGRATRLDVGEQRKSNENSARLALNSAATVPVGWDTESVNPNAGTENRPAGCDHPSTEIIKSSDRRGTVAAGMIANLLQAAHRLKSVLTEHFAEFGLSEIRYSVLRYLRDAAPGGSTQSQLAQRLSQSESSVCTLVRRMRAADLLFRIRSETDQRKWLLSLSERGRTLLQQVEACHGERMSVLLASFTLEQLSSLVSLLRQLSQELNRLRLPNENSVVSATTAAVQTILPEIRDGSPVEIRPPFEEGPGPEQRKHSPAA